MSKEADETERERKDRIRRQTDISCWEEEEDEDGSVFSEEGAGAEEDQPVGQREVIFMRL